MSVRLGAPYPTIETLTYLPNPEFSDVRRAAQSVSTRRSMSNFLRSYVKTSPRLVFNYTFTMTRQKALELRAFIEAYYASKIHLTDHDGRVWSVNFTSNPFELNGGGRAVDQPGEEYATIQLTFEGEEF